MPAMTTAQINARFAANVARWIENSHRAPDGYVQHARERANLAQRVADAADADAAEITRAILDSLYAVEDEIKADYRIVRSYERDGRRTIKSGISLRAAQAHCSDPETSSSTCKKAHNRRRTATRGPWRDGYERT